MKACNYALLLALAASAVRAASVRGTLSHRAPEHFKQPSSKSKDAKERFSGKSACVVKLQCDGGDGSYDSQPR